MRKAILFGVCLFFAGLVSAQRNVFEAYQSLGDIDDFLSGYVIKKGAGSNTYTAILLEDLTEEAPNTIPVEMDLKNGYLRFVDEGTGGGSVTTTMVIYRKADGGELAIAQKLEFDGVATTPMQAYYESKADGTWAKVSFEQLFPDFGYHSFFASKPNVAGAADKLLLNFALPRQGTTIKVTLDYSSFAIACDSDDMGEDIAICKLLGKEKYKTIELKWNKAQKKFSIAAKK